MPLKYEPGTTWWYSRATDVLGRLVEVVSGMTLEQFFQQRILQPLDMKDTSFTVNPCSASRFAQPFDSDREGLILQYTNPLKPVKFEAGGQGLTSTVRDYARFLQMMLNGGELDGTRILGRKTVELMTMDHVGDVVDHFRAVGGASVTVSSADYVFGAESAAYAALLRELGLG